MTLSLSPIFASLRQLITHPWFWLALLSAAILGVSRSFVWMDWFSLISAALFVGGTAIGFWLTLSHESWMASVLRNVPTLDENDVSAIAVLRSPLMLLLLPILGTFLLFLPESAIGLGVFWGVLLWYASEAWQLLRAQPEWLAKYFPGQSSLQSEPMYLGVLWGFLGFSVIFALVLLLF